MKILVTGANGFIGSHLCAELVKRGHSVVGTRRSTSSVSQFDHVMRYHGLEADQVEWRITSLSTPWEIEEALSGVNAVYHTAGKVSFERKDAKALIESNVALTARIVNSCNSNNLPMCHFSSTAVFPFRAAEHMDWPLNNPEGERSVYGESKYLAELEVWRGREEGLDAVIMNPGIVLGYGDWNSGSTALFKKAVEGFPFFTDGGTGFVGVSDVCNAAIGLMEARYFQERFLLVESNYRFKAVQDMMAFGFGSNPPKFKVGKLVSYGIAALGAPVSWMGGKPLITRETARSAHRMSRFNGSRISQTLDHFEYTPIEQVINQACEGFKNQPIKKGR